MDLSQPDDYYINAPNEMKPISLAEKIERQIMIDK
jgi:hypothetical protein